MRFRYWLWAAVVLVCVRGTTFSQVVAVTENATDDRHPQISGQSVVWAGSDGGDYEIFIYSKPVGPTIVVSAITPAHAAVDVARDTNIVVEFSAAISNETVSAATFKVWGKQTGFRAGVTSEGSVHFDPATDFKAGEEVVVMLGSGIRSSSNGLLRAFQSQFSAAADGCSFYAHTDSGQALGAIFSASAALGDLDGDGDVDAFVGNGGPNRVWLNGGGGFFANSGQSLGASLSFGVRLGDLDGDGDLDVFVANRSGGANRVWLNSGAALFADSGQLLGSASSYDVELGDLDGDGDLDAFVAEDGANTVWFNDGSALFSDSGQALGSLFSKEVRLGDLDGDGDLDAVVVNSSGGSQIWLNDGKGAFTAGETIADDAGEGLALGDVDGDGDLDAFIVYNAAPAKVYINDGAATFTDSGQSLGSAFSEGVALGDVDGDGDLDAFVANSGEPNTVWLNDGNGAFSDSGQALGFNSSAAVGLADLDGDNDLDAFIANANGEPNRVWFNSNCNGDAPAEFEVVSTSPTANALHVNAGATISVQFDKVQSNETVNAATFRVWGRQTGFYPGAYSFASAHFDAASLFKAGEEIVVMLNAGITSDVGLPLIPHQWQFVVAADGCDYYKFVDTGQALGATSSSGVRLGDLDGDGDLDVFVVNSAANRVWTNDGAGVFYDSSQVLGASASQGVDIGDLDGDGDLDAFVVNLGSANRVWRNVGGAVFVDSGQSLGGAVTSYAVALGDVDGDGDLDAVVANNGANTVWINNGAGTFGDSGQSLGAAFTKDVKLGDLTGDGNLDAFFANLGGPNTVWTNDGSGIFYDTGQSLADNDSEGVALGDLDGDGRLDAFVANQGGTNVVWLNQGGAVFAQTHQALGLLNSVDVALADVDGDGDLDAVIANSLGHTNRVWHNDGLGLFTDSGQSLGGNSQAVALGDIDGDRLVDAFFANGSGAPDRVWHNEKAVDIQLGKTIGNPIPTNGEIVVYTVTAFNDGCVPATGVQITDVLPAAVGFDSYVASQGDYNPISGIWSVGGMAIGAGETLSITVTASVDTTSGHLLVTNGAVLSAVNEPDFIPGNDAAIAAYVADFGITGIGLANNDPVLDVKAWSNGVYGVQAYAGVGALAGHELGTVAATGNFTFVDTDLAVSADSERQYRIVDKTGHLLNPLIAPIVKPDTKSAYCAPTTAAEWFMISVPTDYGSSNRLDGAVGSHLAQGLAGGGPDFADQLYLIDSNGTFQVFYLDAGGVWLRATDDTPADETILPTQSLWIRRRNLNGDSKSIFVGVNHSGRHAFTFRPDEWHLIAWPFADPRREQDGWGFTNGRKSLVWQFADLLILGQGNDSRFLYQRPNARWYRIGGQTPAANEVLELGKGYYYYHRGSGFEWTPSE